MRVLSRLRYRKGLDGEPSRPIAGLGLRFEFPGVAEARFARADDVFIDTGADFTALLDEWVFGAAPAWGGILPAISNDGEITSPCEVRIGDWSYRPRGLKLCRRRLRDGQKDSFAATRPPEWAGLREMPGREQILLGRDILDKLVAVFDGPQQAVSLLDPRDGPNRVRVTLLRRLI